MLFVVRLIRVYSLHPTNLRIFVPGDMLSEITDKDMDEMADLINSDLLQSANVSSNTSFLSVQMSRQNSNLDVILKPPEGYNKITHHLEKKNTEPVEVPMEQHLEEKKPSEDYNKI